MKNKIQFFITGGTFDKEYNYITGELFFKDTHLPEMLERGRSTLSLDFKTLMMIDSIHMSEADRKIISYSCSNSAYDNIIITHGTDTMVNTAKYIHENADIESRLPWQLCRASCSSV